MLREEIIKGLKIATRKIGGCCDNGGWLDNDEALARKSCEEAIELLEQQPCDDAISRQAVLNILKDKWNMFSDANDAMQESIDTIEALSSVTPQPKTGHWIMSSDRAYSGECSVCNREVGELFGYVKKFYKYCPYCGAKMEGESNES